MKLEEQVCSLELAKRLKELRVEQKSIVYWWSNSTLPEPTDYLLVFKESIVDRGLGTRNIIAAFTVSEFGEMLPWNYVQNNYSCEMSIRKNPDTRWMIEYRSSREFGSGANGVTLADALASMLIHLIEKGIVKP